LTIATPKPEPKPTPKPETKPATKPENNGHCGQKHGFFSGLSCFVETTAHAAVSVAGGIAQGVGHVADGILKSI